MDADRRLTGGLDTHFLQHTFVWLLTKNASPPPSEGQEIEGTRRLVLAFWAHEAWCRSGSADEDDDYQPMSQLGYEVSAVLARLSFEVPRDRAPDFWTPVFALGPKGHYAIGNFLTSWFEQITDTTDIADLMARWRAMTNTFSMRRIGRLADNGSTGKAWSARCSASERTAKFYAHPVTPPSSRGCVISTKRGPRLSRLKGDEDNLAGILRVPEHRCWAPASFGRTVMDCKISSRAIPDTDIGIGSGPRIPTWNCSMKL